jgi:hypothetical protein
MEQLTKTRFQNVVVNHHLRLGDNLFDPLDPYVLRVNGNTYVKGDISFIGDFVVDGNINMKKDVVIDGSLTVLGKTTSIMSENKIIGDNTLIINANLNDLDTDIIRESGIVIQRPKKDGIHQEPFKIVYKDVIIGDIDHNNILDIGLSGDLHRVATINDYPTNRGVPMWNDASGILDTETNITVERHSIGADTPETSQNLHVRNGTIFNTGRDGQHYDIDILYQPPPKFVFDSSNTTTTTITVNWRKEHVIKRLSFMNEEAPFINTIAVDIQQISPPEKATGWINATTTHPKNALSYTFTYNIVNAITNGSEQLYIDKDCSYNVRVYGLNYVEQTTDNYLYYENLSLKNAGVPREPTIIGFGTSELESIKLLFNAPSDNDVDTEDIQDFPVVVEYLYKYKPIDNGTIRYPTFAHTQNLFTTSYFTSQEEQILNKPITINILNNLVTPVFPGTAYQLTELKAKNEVNVEYSINGVISEIKTETTLPDTNTYYITPTPSASNITLSTLQVFNPAISSIMNVTYYNIHGTASKRTTFQISPNLSTFFVNNNRLGKNAANQILAYAKSYYNLDTNTSGTQGTYVLDTTIEYKGYSNQTTNGTFDINYANETAYANYENINCLDAKKTTLENQYNGFGLYGIYKIKPSGINTIFIPSQKIYALKYTIENKGGALGLTTIKQTGTTFATNQEQTHVFVVDDLNQAPTITNINNTTTITSVLYAHGIPSIQNMTILIEYTINNIGSNFLPSNKIISTITSSNKLSGLSITNITADTIPSDKTQSVSKIYTNCSIVTNVVNTLLNSAIIENAVNVKPINLLYTSQPNVNITLKQNNDSTNKFWFDVKSYIASSNKINSLNSIATNVLQYDPLNKYVLSNYTNTNSIIYNQLLYVDGGFTNNKTYYQNYSSGYIYSGPDYSIYKETGDVEDGKTYKWVVFKLTTTSLAGSTQYKTVSLTINGINYTLNNISSLDSSIRIMTIQLFTSGVKHTEWLNARKEFNADFSSLNTENSGNLTSIGGINYLVYKDQINTTFNFYIRIGLPVNTTNFSISNVSFANK